MRVTNFVRLGIDGRVLRPFLLGSERIWRGMDPVAIASDHVHRRNQMIRPLDRSEHRRDISFIPL